MSNSKMLIDASHPEETRVVVLKGNRIEEFDFESASKKQLRGNIYLAKVTRVEPSLQAAFVEYGGNRHGFLAFSEIHPDYYQIPFADRQALLEEEARAHRDEEDEPAAKAAARRVATARTATAMVGAAAAKVGAMPRAAAMARAAATARAASGRLAAKANPAARVVAIATSGAAATSAASGEAGVIGATAFRRRPSIAPAAWTRASRSRPSTSKTASRRPTPRPSRRRSGYDARR